MKKTVAVIVSISLMLALILSVSACGFNGSQDKELPQGNGSQKKVGIVQIVEHPSLNTIRESFIEQLMEEGYEDGKNILIDYQNAQNDQSNLKTICQKFANNQYDLIVAIATPSAQAAVGETRDIPVLFSACTDPIGAGLVTSMEKPGGNVTGTSDAVSAEKIMELANRITPGIKKIGAYITPVNPTPYR